MMGCFVFGVNADQRALILPFHNTSEDILAKDLQENIPALLEVFFSQSGWYTLVDRGNLDQIIEEQKMALTWPVSEEQRQALGKLLQASVIISGGFIKEEQKLIIHAHATEVESGRLLASGEVKGKDRQLAELIHDMYKILAKDLKKELPEPGAYEVDTTPVSNLHFMRGLSFYYGAQYNQAIGEFIQAAEEENLMALASLWSANCYLAQNDYGHAYIELKRLRLHEDHQLKTEEIEQKLNLCLENLSVDEVKLYNLILSP